MVMTDKTLRASVRGQFEGGTLNPVMGQKAENSFFFLDK